MDTPLRLIVYDPTDTRSLLGADGVLASRVARAPGRDGTSARGLGLSPIWKLGARLHQRAGRAADAYAAASWRAALHWAVDLARVRNERIGEIQVWGHGGWGFMRLGDDQLDAHVIEPAATLGDEIDALRRVLAPGALFWLRCCSAFGAPAGRAFAQALASRLDARVAGHTFIIGAFQSGTHSLAPGERPPWPEFEGVELAEDGRTPLRARGSNPLEPNTITALHPGLPAGW